MTCMLTFKWNTRENGLLIQIASVLFRKISLHRHIL